MDEAQRELIRRAREGDGWAFEQLVSEYDGLILALARDMVGNLPDAQDVYQEAKGLACRHGRRRSQRPGPIHSNSSTWSAQARQPEAFTT